MTPNRHAAWAVRCALVSGALAVAAVDAPAFAQTQEEITQTVIVTGSRNHDLRFSYDFGDTSQACLGIDNVMDKDPPFFATSVSGQALDTIPPAATCSAVRTSRVCA